MSRIEPILQMHQLAVDHLGVIVVDHGSRREESNQLLLAVVDDLRAETGLRTVEAAHMELAEPSIQTAYDRVVKQGAKLIIVHPYFLAPGRHWHQDIPRLAADAAQRHPGTQFLVTAPLGLHPAMLQIIQDRIQQCLYRSSSGSEPCEVCQETNGCQILPRGTNVDDPRSA